MKITVGQLRSLVREAVGEMEFQKDSYGLEDYGVDLGDQHLRAGVDPDVRVDTCITCGENKLGAQAYTVGASGQTTPSWFECGECNPEGLARASADQKDDFLAGGDPGLPYSKKTEGIPKRGRTLTEGWASKEEFDTELQALRRRAADAHFSAEMSDDHGAWHREKAAARKIDDEVKALEKAGAEAGFYEPPKPHTPKKLSPAEMEFAVGAAGQWERMMHHNPDKAEAMANAWEKLAGQAAQWNRGELRGVGIESITDDVAAETGLKRWDVAGIVNRLFTKDRGSRLTAADFLARTKG